MRKHFCWLIFLAACASSPPKPLPEKIFPFGTYHHQISVKIHSKGMDFNFNGINQWTKERFIVAGLGPMDMTLIKYEEDRVNYKKDLFINKEILPLDEDRALKLMSLMKEMYTWDRSICQDKKCRDTFWGIPVDIELNDKYEVSKIMVSHGDVEVNVEVTAYEKTL